MSTDLIRALGDRLEQRRPSIDTYDRYYGGKQPAATAFIAPEVRALVGNRLKTLAVNWPRMAVAAVAERLEVVGFRLADADTPDPRLWGWWGANTLDEGSDLAHHDALVHGAAYVSVWAGPDGAPSIRAESARQMIIDYAPGSGQRRAALKLWREDGWGRATVYTPDVITRWRSSTKLAETGEAVPAAGWTQIEAIDNPLGAVPVVELRNGGRLLGEAESELVDVVGITDGLAKLLTDMMTSAEFAAMPRRWATGVELPDTTADPDGDTDPEPFSRTPGRTWLLEDPEARVGQFPEASLDGYVHAVELLTQQLASVTAIPAHYLNSLTGQLPSAESLKAAEASLVAKVRRKQRSFGRSWGEVMRLAVMVADGRDPGTITTVWADPETRTFAQQADAAAKLHADGLLPWAAAVARLGYTPDEIDAMRTQRRADALDAAAVNLDTLV